MNINVFNLFSSQATLSPEVDDEQQISTSQSPPHTSLQNEFQITVEDDPKIVFKIKGLYMKSIIV